MKNHILILLLTGGLAVSAAGAREIGESALRQMQALRQEKASWTPAQKKINARLLLEMKRRLRRATAAGLPAPRSAPAVDGAGCVLVDLQAVVSAALLRRIEELGGQVVSSFAHYGAVRALVPLARLEDLASENAVRSIRPADRPLAHKTNTSEGVAAHRADAARATYGVDGAGVRVGVLSDSIEALGALQATGDLPADVTCLPGQAGSGNSEGTAMLEIVHDVAPGAALYFATAGGGQAQFAANILALQAAGCKVIVDDIIYLNEPVFQDGIIAQAVETAAAAGAVYFSSAGNSGNLNDGTAGVWEGDFAAMPAPALLAGAGDDAHDYGGGIYYNTITADSPSYFTLQWADAWGASANDYDLFLLDSALTNILDYSVSEQSGTQDPFEYIDSLAFNDTGYVLVIIRYAGAGRYLHLNANRGRLAFATAGQTWGHSAAASAFSVAAVNAATAGGGSFAGGASNPVETFSSDGPRRVFFTAAGAAITPGNFSATGGTVRQKPDCAAADGVSCATPGFNPFYGTSAAAPHGAGIAALIIERGICTTPLAVRQALTNTAWDIEAPGLDRDSGCGIVNALAAVGFAGVAPGQVRFSASSYAVKENGGAVTITVARASGNFGAASVNYATTGATAVAGVDFVSKAGALNWAAGDSGHQTFTVKINDNEGYDGNKTFAVRLSDAAGASLGTPAYSTVTIMDNEFPPAGILQFSADAAGINEDGGIAVLTVLRAGGSVGAASVNYATADGSAAAGLDYVASAGTLTWPTGDSASRIVTVPINYRTGAQGSRTFNVNLSGASGAPLGAPATLAVTIHDAGPLAPIYPPAEVFASDGNYLDKVRITWSAVVGAAGYRVFRDTDEDSAGAIQIGAVAGPACDDTSAAPGVTHYYWVQAVNATNASAFSAPDTGYAGVEGPLVSVNGLVGDHVRIRAGVPVAVAVEVMNLPDDYIGHNVDWWVAAYDHDGGLWFYLDSAMAWMPFDGNLDNCRPAYQGPLNNIPAFEILRGASLAPGVYSLWFAVDYPMDGRLSLAGPNLVSRVTLAVE